MLQTVAIDLSPSQSRPPMVSAWRPGKGINTGADLRQACSPTSGQGGKIACVYFLNGVLNDVSTGAMAAEQHAGKPFRPIVCVPPTVSLDGQLAALVSGINAQPKLAGAPAAVTIRFVYSRNWACKP